MEKEIPKCNTCGMSMFEIGETGGSVHYVTENSFGVRKMKLYQCPECKDVKIN